MATIDRAQVDGVVAGLRQVSGTRLRVDIDELILTEPDVTNLYILALEELQRDSGKMGWFQVTGGQCLMAVIDSCN